jgi:hypothetical protein
VPGLGGDGGAVLIVTLWDTRAECEVRFGPFGTDGLADHFINKALKEDRYQDARVNVVNQPNLLNSRDVLVDAT